MLVTLNLEDIASVVAEAVEQQITLRTADLRTEVDDLKAEADALRELMFQQKVTAPDISAEIGAHVRAHLIDALEEVELPAGPPGPQGPAGPAGRDGVDGWNGQDGAAGPKGEKGEPGIDGKDGTPGPEGQKGDPGVDGRDGLDGTNGKDGAPGQDGQKGLDGKDGLDGNSGRDGSDGINGKDGLDGLDGRGLAGAVIDRSGWLVVTFTDGSTAQLGQVVGKDGEPGINGKDGAPGRNGFDLRDFSAALLGDGRTLQLKYAQDGESQVHEFVLPINTYEGVWKDGQEYQRGMAVTHAGSAWHCNKSTTEKPGTGPHWTLMVKRGSNGKDGKDGKPGERGPEGKMGRDLTQMGADGSKW